jgi:hypothetical protein
MLYLLNRTSQRYAFNMELFTEKTLRGYNKICWSIS